MSKHTVVKKYKTFYKHLLLLSSNKWFELPDNIKCEIEKLSLYVYHLIEYALQLDDNNQMWCYDLDLCYERYVEQYFKLLS
jgi:hypothetical protein